MSYLKKLEYLAASVGVEIFWDAKKEWFTVKLGNNAKISNPDLKETIIVAYDIFIKMEKGESLE